MAEWISIALAEEWVKIALVAGSAAFFGTLVGAWLSRPRSGAGEAKSIAHVSPPQIEKPSPEDVALLSYRKILEEKDVSSKDLDTRMQEFGRQFGELREKLHAFSADDLAVQALLEEARAALDMGDFDRAVALLGEAGECDAAAGRELRDAAEKRLRTAATAKVVAGDLQSAQLAYEEAAQCYHEAVVALPGGCEDVLAEYLNKHGTVAYHAGDHATATVSFEKALKILESTLGENHPDVATGLNNLALLHYSPGQLRGRRAPVRTRPDHRRKDPRARSFRRCHGPQQPGPFVQETGKLRGRRAPVQARPGNQGKGLRGPVTPP